jgi:hypothetical protein
MTKREKFDENEMGGYCSVHETNANNNLDKNLWGTDH